MISLLDIANGIVEFRQDVEDFRSTGIYEFCVKWFAEFIKWYLVGWYKVKLQSITFAWDIAQEILTSLSISEKIDLAFSALDSLVVQVISFFRIPEAINIVLSAYTTRFVLNFLGL